MKCWNCFYFFFTFVTSFLNYFGMETLQDLIRSQTTSGLVLLTNKKVFCWRVNNVNYLYLRNSTNTHRYIKTETKIIRIIYQSSNKVLTKFYQNNYKYVFQQLTKHAKHTFIVYIANILRFAYLDTFASLCNYTFLWLKHNSPSHLNSILCLATEKHSDFSKPHPPGERWQYREN